MQLKQGLRIADLPALGFAIASLFGTVAALFVPCVNWLALLVSIGFLTASSLALLFLKTRWIGAVLVYCAVAAIVCFQAETQIARSDRALLARLDPDTAIVACRGVVVLKEAASGSSHSDKLWLQNVRIALSDTVLESNQLQVRLTLPIANSVDIEIGDVIACAARIEPANHRQARSARELMWSLRERQWADARLADPGSLVVAKGRSGIRGTIADVRNVLLDVLAARLSPDARAVAGALLLGSRETFSGEFRAELQTTGLAHLFALSGLNTGLLVSLCWIILSWLFVPRRARYVVLLAMLLCYTLLGYGVPSLFRSAIMAGLFILGRLLAKPSHPANLLLFAFAIELLFRPLHLLDAGFLLSYLSMAGILAAYISLSQPIQNLLSANVPGFRRRISDTLSSTFGAQLATAPMVGMLFTRVPGLAILANLVAIPAFSLLVVLILLLLLLDPISSWTTIPIARAIEGIVWVFAWFTEKISDFPGASFSLRASVWIIALAFGAQLLAIVYCLRARLFIGALWILISLNLLIWPSQFAAEPTASCAKIGDEAGSVFLVQARDFACVAGLGAEWEGERNAAALREKLTSKSVLDIDAVIIGSERAGQVGGAPAILSLLQPNVIFDFSDPRHTLTASRFRAAVQISNIRVHRPTAGETLRFHESKVSVLWPPVGSDLSGGALLVNAKEAKVLFHCGIDSTDVWSMTRALGNNGSVISVDLDNGEVQHMDSMNSGEHAWEWKNNRWQVEESQGQRLMKLWSIASNETI